MCFGRLCLAPTTAAPNRGQAEHKTREAARWKQSRQNFQVFALVGEHSLPAEEFPKLIVLFRHIRVLQRLLLDILHA